MKLIRRRQSPNPAQKTFNVVRLALRGLVVQRIARNAFRLYKFGRRLPLMVGGAVVGAFALKKLRGSGDGGGPETWTAPPATPAPEPIQTSAPSAPSSSADSSAPDEPSSPVETAATGTPPVEDIGPETVGGPEVPATEDGAPDPDIVSGVAATDAGTTGGGSGAAAEDAATAIGDDLAAAADSTEADEGADKS